ncbi:hypothetical protein LTS12_027599 [Elasticomyces elasticus]|nr:hypothetical protein LTS12_027599 [Elasticomyces elasticus]
MVHGISQPMLLPQQQHHMLHRHMAPQYPPPGSLGLLSPHRGQKRSLEGTESDHDDGGRSAIRRHLPGFPSVEGTADAAAHAPDFLFPPHPEHPSVTHHEFDPQASGAAMGVPHQHQQQHHHHHHHRLPPHAPLPTTGHPHDVNAHSQSYMTGPPSVVGQPGMPKPAPRPKGPKLKFSPVEDTTLVHLKEEKNLTWKQIADFFPGRTSGTLQVRYCTKLKAKDVIWTDDMIQRLARAMDEYEKDRWRIVAGKVGNGFTPAACREKGLELDLMRQEERQQHGDEHDPHEDEEDVDDEHAGNGASSG